MSVIKRKNSYGWVVVFAAFILMVAVFGTSFSFGVFFKSIEKAFDLSRTTTSSIISASMVFSGVFAVISGWAVDRYGARIIALLMGLFTGLSLILTSQTNGAWQLFITYSLLLAIGTGPIYVVTMSTTMKWFEKRRGLAVGIAGSGAGIGQMLMAPLAAFFISNYDWRVAYIIFGVIAWLLMIPASRFLKGNPRDIGVLSDGIEQTPENLHLPAHGTSPEILQTTGLSLSQAIRTRSYWIIIVIWFALAVIVMLTMTHIVPHATDIGYSAGQAAAILSLAGISSTTGTALMGFVCDRIGRRTTVVICGLFISIPLVGLVWSQSLWMLYLFAVLFGLGSGGLSTSTVALVGDILGVKSIGVLLGTMDVGWWAGAALGPLLGGYIFDVYQSYSLAFIIIAVFILLASILVMFIRDEIYYNARRAIRA
ncbi:MFS transporter [Chloroflexota bacterium]